MAGEMQKHARREFHLLFHEPPLERQGDRGQAAADQNGAEERVISQAGWPGRQALREVYHRRAVDDGREHHKPQRKAQTDRHHEDDYRQHLWPCPAHQSTADLFQISRSLSHRSLSSSVPPWHTGGSSCVPRAKLMPTDGLSGSRRQRRSWREVCVFHTKRGENAPQDIDGGRRAARYGDVDGKQIRERPAHGVAFLKNATCTRALAERDDQLRMWRRLVRSPYCLLHVQCERAGDQQHVGMAGTRDELDTQPFDVVVRIVERVDLQFAAVARASIDRANAQRPAEHVEYFLLDPLAFGTPCVIALGQALSWRAGLGDLFEKLPHYRSCPA